MVGIVSYGAYIPFYRLALDEIAKAWGQGSAEGEKAVANYDEDSLTMGVEAIFDCLSGIDQKSVQGLFFASTTFPYREKQTSSLAASVADLDREITTADFSNSLRAGTTALREAINAASGGLTKSVIVVASDCRLAHPDSDLSLNLGDGAAALLVGENNVIAAIKDFYSVSDEFIGTWRRESDTFINVFEARYNRELGYMRNMSESISGILKKNKMGPKDFSKVVLFPADRGGFSALARNLGFSSDQLQDPLLSNVGNTGSAHVLIMLASALEEAKPGDKILAAAYGDGSDAMILEVTEEIESFRKASKRRGVKGYLKSGRLLPDYARYIRYRRLLEKETFMPRSSPIVFWREEKQLYRLYGAKCKKCSTVHTYPIERVCYKCRAKDSLEDFKLSKRGKVFTYTIDYIPETVDVPAAMTVFDLDGGGRLWIQATDCDPYEVTIDLPLELTFRRYHEGMEFINYYWKVRPIREGRD